MHFMRLCFLAILLSTFFLVSPNFGQQPKFFSVDDILEQSERQRHWKKCCGPLALARCLALLDSKVPFDVLLSEFQDKSAGGVEIRDLLSIANRHQPSAKGLKVRISDLGALAVPSILLVQNVSHCVVLERVADDRKVRVWDPATLRSTWLTERQLSELWSGEAIVFAPVKPRFTWSDALVAGLVYVNLFATFKLLQTYRRRTAPS
jgi:ABC-type bacteriocin/lantibiotic exporter with double-glycine peptidase domain